MTCLYDTSSITSDILRYHNQFLTFNSNIILPGYNDIGLYDTSSIASDILRYHNQFLTVNHNITLPGYNDIGLYDTKYSAPFMML